MNSLELQAVDAGKRFGREWVFRSFNARFESGHSYAILGHNGSGKSTLLLSLSGYYRLNQGAVNWRANGKDIPEDRTYAHYSLISPLLELPEELSIQEFWKRHFEIKPLKSDWTIERMLEITGLARSRDKNLKQLSSGMLQRVKLMAAFAADVEVLFLDEPCTNLDWEGIKLYHELVTQCKGQLVVVASNMEAEYDFVDERLNIESFKRKAKHSG